MGMLNCLDNPIFKFSHITEASVSEFEIDGHFYTSPNQQEEPPTFSFSHSEPLPDDARPCQLRGRVWALHNHPYLPFVLFSPFLGAMTSRFATPPEEIPIDKDFNGYHLPEDVSKSWKTLEQTCHQIIVVLSALFEELHPKTLFSCAAPPKPSHFGYSKEYRTESKARLALSDSVDTFVLLFAYVSFYIAICRDTSKDPTSISLSSATATQPNWFQRLSERKSKIHPGFLRLLADSPISNFTTTTARTGSIINVSRCSWLSLVPYMLKANLPIWFYWGIPPVFVQPLLHNALIFAPRSHPQSRALPLPVITPSQSVGFPTSSTSQSIGFPTPSASQSVGLPTPSASQSDRLPARSALGGPGQLPGETWQDFMSRQNLRRKKELSKENDVDRRAREGRENSAATKSCPGKKGPAVFIWENEGGVWTRTYLNRGEVERNWGRYRSTQMIYNSVENCWDLCFEFDADTGGEIYENDSNDSDNDTYRPPTKQSRRSPTPKNGRSGDGSACPPIVVDSESTPLSVQIPGSDLVSMDVQVDVTPLPVSSPGQVTSDLSMVVDATPLPVSSPGQVTSDLSMVVDATPLPVLSPGQVTADLSMAVDATPLPVSSPAQVGTHDLQHPNPQSEGDHVGADEDDELEDPYDASREDVFNAYSFVALDLEQMPVTTLGGLLYYRYGFSLKEFPYSGIPPSSSQSKQSFRSWTEVCRAVGGQQLESSVTVDDRAAIQDFLSILAESSDPFEEVPGKYWDLSSSGLNPIVELCKVFISIEERQFTDGKHYIIRPRFLHPSRDSSWLLSVDPITALECIRRGLGPHTVDIGNFLISHGVRFRTLQQIPNALNSENPARPRSCRYLGNRPVGYSFDLADFAGYEVLRDSFLRSQPHGPLALREGGIIARLAREVLPNSNALSGPSSEALSGQRAQFQYGDKIYVDDNFSEVELGLICGTYALGNQNARGGNEISFFSSGCYY
jgi:hypothetical protein